MSRLYIITGDRGAGKSTFCEYLVELAGPAGWQVGGILSPAVIEAGQKTGIAAIDLRRGEQRLLAVRREAHQPVATLRTNRWSFDADVMAWGNAVLQTAVPCDLLVIDELGPLEFERGEGWPAGLTALDSGNYRWGVVVIRPELLAVARPRWPAAQVISIATAANSRPMAHHLAQEMGLTR